MTLLPIPFKVFERVIVWKLDKYSINTTLHTLQGGFHYKRGVLEQLGTLRVVSDIAKKRRLPLYVASLDIRKAYDMVWRNAITYKLHHEFGVPIPLCRVIQAMLNGTRAGLRNGCYVSHIFQTTNGVVQGSVVAPMLYGIFINDLITDLVNSNIGATYLTVPQIAALFYCDDILLLTHQIPELKTLLSICEPHSNKWRYQFNPDKCHVFSFNCPEPAALVLNTTQRKAITREYNETRLINRNNTNSTAPLIIELFHDTRCTGPDIYGQTRTWLYHNLPSTLARHLKKHVAQTTHLGNIKYPIYWKQTTQYTNSSTVLQLRTCQMYAKPLHYASLSRYLGAELHVHDPDNIISITHTMKRFTQKMRYKLAILCKKLPVNLYTLPHYNFVPAFEMFPDCLY